MKRGGSDMAKRFSILVKDLRRCAVCGRIAGIELHEIYFGRGKRDLSIQYGLVVPLCVECHRGTNGVHGKNGHALDAGLKKRGQEAFEKAYPDKDFLTVFGRQYK